MVKIENIKKNKHGFTLIELLAVIIILGILLLIAVPAVSKYIEKSRKSTYINSVQSIVGAVAISVNNLEYPIPGKNEAIIVPFSEVELEKGTSNKKSPFGEYEDGKSYVIVTFDGTKYHYYVTTLDKSGYSIPLIDSKYLNEDSITTDTSVINNNVYALNDFNGSNVIDTYQFAMKFKEKSADGKIIKVAKGDSVYEKGDVVQLKDGSKWYVLPQKDENAAIIDDSLENNTVNLVSFNHMDIVESRYGFQSDDKYTPNSKTNDKLVYEHDIGGSYDYANDGTPQYMNADIFETSQTIITKTSEVLRNNGINITGMTVVMPSVTDFCGGNYAFPGGICRLTYLAGNGGFWTQDYSSSNVLVIANGGVSATSPHYGSISANPDGYGLRVVIRNILKSNIDKAATKALN